jgi:cob(I)alamin adenosyltransferase
MKIAQAELIVEAARAKAKEIGKPVSVAVVDAAGAMVLFARLDGAAPFTAVVAEGKAAASALCGFESATLTEIAQHNPPVFSAIAARMAGQRFTPARGGVPFRNADGIVGAVGVSGATSDEDEAIARAGLEAVQKS